MFNFLVALTSELPFKIAYKRAKCLSKGHVIKNSELIDKLQSEKHPHTNKEWIYTVNIMKCGNCGLHFNDAGVEARK